jgi:hypothetical protein
MNLLHEVSIVEGVELVRIMGDPFHKLGVSDDFPLLQHPETDFFSDSIKARAPGRSLAQRYGIAGEEERIEMMNNGLGGMTDAATAAGG